MVLRLNDFELIYMVKQKDEEAYKLVFEKYQRVIWRIINNSYYLPKGVEKGDLYQEGLIAVNDALSGYRDDLQVPFYSFVYICVERQIQTVLRKYNSLSNKQFYNSLSLDMQVMEDENIYLGDIIPDNRQGVSYLNLFSAELEELLSEGNDLLSEIEKKVLKSRLLGYSYQEIAFAIQKNSKYVDNIIQRIKLKTKNY